MHYEEDRFGNGSGFPVGQQRSITPQEDIAEVFFRLTELLSKYFEVERGVLILKREDHGEYRAVAGWRQGREPKHLNLRMPESSLMAKVGEDGHTFVDEYCELFSGNSLERRLLLGQESQSYIIQPLICDTQLKGVIGYSSADVSAFVTHEGSILDKLAKVLAEKIDEIGAA